MTEVPIKRPMTLGEMIEVERASELADVNDEIEEITDEIARIRDEMRRIAPPDLKDYPPVQEQQQFIRFSREYRRLLQRRAALEDDALVLAEDDRGEGEGG